MKILLGITGSVAAILAPKLIQELVATPGIELRIVVTQRSLHFWNPLFGPLSPDWILSVQALPQIFQDSDEWTSEQYTPKSPVLHIELRNWADLLLIAPLSANTLAKMAQGFCDNLLTSVVRAWDRSKPVILAPAMNTQMWTAPITDEHLTKIASWYSKFEIVPPVNKMLACGEEGVGAMAPIETIVEKVLAYKG